MTLNFHRSERKTGNVFSFAFYTGKKIEEAITEDFFILSTCLADEILQKFINYGVKFSIYGDFSGYNSKPLKDFIYECNNGKDIFFTSDMNDAINKLSTAR